MKSIAPRAILSPGLLRLGQAQGGLIKAGFRFTLGHRRIRAVLRQMRDLRRYAPPVIVNNGGQVNVATDGGQQVNIVE